MDDHRPTYETYTLEQLREALQSLDKDRFPDRLQEINALIEKRRETPLPPPARLDVRQWWSANKFWALLMLLLPVVLIIALGALGNQNAGKNHPVYLDAVRYLQEDEVLAERVGSPMEVGIDSFQVQNWGMQVVTFMNIPFKGPGDSGVARIRSKMVEEKNRFDKFLVVLSDTTIDFMADK